MQKNSHIESFFNSLDFNWQDLIEFLPIGVVFFDDHWKIRAVNRNFSKFFDDEWIDIKLEGVNIFSKNILSQKLPLKDILKLKDGKHFAKIIYFFDKQNRERKIIAKGSPILKDGNFQGGTIIFEDYSIEFSDNKSVPTSESSLINFICKISNSFLVLDNNGYIKFISEIKDSKNNFLLGNEGRLLSEIFNLEEQTSLEYIIKEIVNEKKSKSLELKYYSDNEIISFKSVLIPFTNKDNDVDSVILLLRQRNSSDVDSLTFLSESNNLKEYESFAKLSSDGLFKINLRGNITFWSDSAYKLFGYNEKDVISQFVEVLFPEISHQHFSKIRAVLIEHGKWEGFLKYTSGSSDEKLQVQIISRNENNVTELFVFCLKIDKNQQQIINAKEEGQLFFKDTVIKSDEIILQINPSGIILFVNEKFCNDFGYNLDEIMGKEFTSLLEPEFKINNSISDFEYFLNKKEIQILPLRYKNGNTQEYCFSLNISTSKNEAKYFTIYLKECSTKDQLFLQTAHSLLYNFNKAVVIIYEDKIIKVNPNFCKLFGSEFETDFFNQSARSIIASNSDKEFHSLIKKNDSDSQEVKLNFVRKDGTQFEANATRICCQKDSSFSVIIIQPTVKADLKEISKLDQIKNEFKNTGPYYWSGLIKNNKIIADYISSELLNNIGYSGIELGSIENVFDRIIHPDDIEKVTGEIEKIISGENENPCDVIYRVINKTGDVIWINNRIKIKKGDDENYPVFGAITDVTKITLEKEELRSIINELDKLNSAKEKFISIISHDLKSPFTSIVGFSELILTDPELEKEEILEYVSHIKDASLHTIDLLNGLLDLTKLQTGRIEVEPKVVNANYLVKKTLEIMYGLALQKGLKISSDTDKSLFINVDDNLVFQVFNNLVANSIKFTPKGGEIEITAKEIPNKHQIEFTVRDTGVGIDGEDLKKLFVIDEKFTTLGTEGERGTGLGLNLVKEIIDKHNGKIWVESEVGKGSKFIFTLPVSSPSILVVDGVEAERNLYAKLIESITSSIPILKAGSEQEALNIIKERMPMLIVLENRLPNMSGHEFIEETNKFGLSYHPSFIILSRNISEKEKEIYQSLGVEALFTKPFNLAEFKSKLDVLTGQIE